MPADRSETYQLQTSPSKWVGGLPVQKGHATIGGKVYPTVKMPDGSVWMAQNLDMAWNGLDTLTDYSDSYAFKYCAYWEFDQTTYGDRGLFYNAPACHHLQNSTSTLCPGWHVPTSDELYSAMQCATNNKDLFEFALTVYGYGNLLNSDEAHGWYESNPGSTIQSKAYLLQYTGPNSYYGYYKYINETATGMSGPWSGSWYYTANYYMPIRLVMDDPSLFVPDTTEDKNVSAVYTKYWHPQLILEFSESDFDPTQHVLISSGTFTTYKWTKVSDSPNRWMLDVASRNNVISSEDPQYGLASLFTNRDSSSLYGRLTPTQMGTCTCKFVGFNNLDNIETMDRFCCNATSLTEIPTSIPFGSYLTNVSQMFYGCSNVTTGALALYNYLKDIPTITTHSETFKGCGSNTVTGLAELQQIPLSWGGLLMPASTTMACARVENSNPKIKWSCGSTAPDWSTEPELYVFTQASVSDYAGVNMRKTMIQNIQNGLATSGAATYYRVAFMQFASGKSGAITWVLTTTGYNGTLSASQSAGDMPGTLSYDNFGVTDKHYGTYDSSKTVYMAFLVTNATPENWGGLTDAYGLQGNNFFKSGIGLQWFTA